MSRINMDTEDLSRESYKGIISEAGKFNRDLRLHFGLLASVCENEKEYLESAKQLIEEIKKKDDNEISDLFFGILPNRKSLAKTLNKILDNIIEIEKIPEKQRHYEF